MPNGYGLQEAWKAQNYDFDHQIGICANIG